MVYLHVRLVFFGFFIFFFFSFLRRHHGFIVSSHLFFSFLYSSRVCEAFIM